MLMPLCITAGKAPTALAADCNPDESGFQMVITFTSIAIQHFHSGLSELYLSSRENLGSRFNEELVVDIRVCMHDL